MSTPSNDSWKSTILVDTRQMNISYGVLLLTRRSLSVERKRSSYGHVVKPICLAVRKVHCGETTDWIRMPYVY